MLHKESYEELWKVRFFTLSKLLNKTIPPFLLLFMVALLFQIKHSPHQGFLQTTQCTGKHSTWHLLTIELLIIDWIYAEENHKKEVLLYY